MPLKKRDVFSDFLPKEGIVDTGYFSQSKDYELAENAQNNFANHKLAVYVPDTEKKREISYSFALANIYKSLNALNNKIKISSSDDEGTRKYKEAEKGILISLSGELEGFYQKVLENEYPDSTAKFENGNIRTNMSGDPLPIQNNEEIQSLISGYIKKINYFNSFIKEKSPNFQVTTMKYLTDYTDKINDKLAGKTVVSSGRTDEDIVKNVKTTMQMLIRDDSFGNVDRERAVNDLAKKMAPLGMQVEIIPVKEETPNEEALRQAKTSILRAAWDGFIERPSPYNCSQTLQHVINHPTPGNTDAEKYKLENNEIWKLCEKVPEFSAIKEDLQKALANRNFPPEKIESLTYADIAYLINEKRQADSSDVERRQKKNKKEADAVKIGEGRRAEYLKKYVEKHGNDLREVFRAKGVSETEINKTLKLMEQGKSNDGLDINEVKKVLKANGSSKENIQKTIDIMHEGKNNDIYSIDDLKKVLDASEINPTVTKTIADMYEEKCKVSYNAHHNFAINDPDTFCKVTGKEWWQMNDHIVLMDKNTHDLLHATENNVKGNGQMMDKEDSTTSYRTIFNDKKTGKKFYVAIRVKEGIDGLLGLHRETIYNKKYLADNHFINGKKIPNKQPEAKNKSEKAEQRKAEKATREQNRSANGNQQALQHAKERKTKLDEQKAAYSVPDNAEKNSKQNPKKERFVTRKDYLGQRNKGGAQKFNAQTR